MPKTSKLGINFPSRSKEYQKAWRELTGKKYDYDKEKKRELAWMSRYGITRDDYDAQLALQNSVCAICECTEPGRKHTHFHVDHNHETGKVRGLLCDLCNRGLGYFKDDHTIIKSAVDYLNKWK